MLWMIIGYLVLVTVANWIEGYYKDDEARRSFYKNKEDL